MFSRVITTILLLFITQSKQQSIDSVNNFCHFQQNELLLISTIDGQISALDVRDNGNIKWTQHINDGNSLFRSTISDFEMFDKTGQSLRIVPSLDGNLYLFDGNIIQMMPFSAEKLLKSSYKFGEDMVICGGYDNHIYAININTGHINYECGVNGCDDQQQQQSTNNHSSNDKPLIIVKRFTQTVRAIQTNNGNQNWFFSVSEPQLTIQHSTQLQQCNNDRNKNNQQLDYEFIVSNGIVSAITDNDKRWHYKCKEPIVQIWHYKNGQLNIVNQFNNDMNEAQHHILIGYYQNQWYIQPSNLITNQLTAKEKKVLQIEWKSDSNEIQLMPQLHQQWFKYNQINSINGYYKLNVNIIDNQTQCHKYSKTTNHNHNEDVSDGGVDEALVMMSSLSYYWREITGISVFVAVFSNFMFYWIKRKLRNKCKQYCHESQQQLTDSNMNVTNSGDSSSSNTVPQFTSRYKEDFEEIRVVGRGGFGVVYEAKHKIDEWCYAVKQIDVSINESMNQTKEKVMREVRALSKLDHINIVRYYNAWIETQPITTTTTHHYDYGDNNTNNDSLEIVFDSNVSPLPLSSSLKTNTTTTPINSMTTTTTTTTANRPNSLSVISSSVSSSPSVWRSVLYIQMQLCQKETLKDWLFANNCIEKRDYNTTMDIFCQIVNAMNYVHSCNLMHRDLKPSNIFFSMDGSIKIGDFGLVTENNNGYTPDGDKSYGNSDTHSLVGHHTQRVGTQLYMSPEQVENCVNYSNKVDIYSMGIILFELLVPFYTEMQRIIELQNARKCQFPNNFQNNYKLEHSLLIQLLAIEPDRRPSSAQIKEHKLLQKFQNLTSNELIVQRRRTLSINE